MDIFKTIDEATTAHLKSKAYADDLARLNKAHGIVEAPPIPESVRKETNMITISIPKIGTEWPGEGGVFAGLLVDEKGRDYALIVPTDPASDIAPAPWKKAIADANAFKTSQHADYTAANRLELAFCFATVPGLFKRDWYWSSTQYAPDPSFAWYQYFSNGYQYYYHKGYAYRARAVRRVLIER